MNVPSLAFVSPQPEWSLPGLIVGVGGGLILIVFLIIFAITTKRRWLITAAVGALLAISSPVVADLDAKAYEKAQAERIDYRAEVEDLYGGSYKKVADIAAMDDVTDSTERQTRNWLATEHNIVTNPEDFRDLLRGHSIPVSINGTAYVIRLDGGTAETRTVIDNTTGLPLTTI